MSPSERRENRSHRAATVMTVRNSWLDQLSEASDKGVNRQKDEPVPRSRLPRAFTTTQETPERLRDFIDIARQNFTPAELDLFSQECWDLDLLPYDDPRVALRFCISQSRHVRAGDRLADKLAEIDKPVAWAVVRCLQALEHPSELHTV